MTRRPPRSTSVYVRFFRLLGLTGLVSLALVGCRSTPVTESRPQRVLLITIDTLRADHLGTYGYARDTSPFLDELARTSVVFERVVSSCPTTSPSHATMFTGLQPNQHRLRENGQPLQSEVTTLASLYSKQGYKTAALSPIGFLAGVANGFDHVDIGGDYRAAGQVFDAASSWIRGQDPGDSLFVWVHLYDVHEWRLGRGRLDEEALEELPARPGLHGAELQATLDPARRAEGSRERLDQYDAQILAVDRELERFFRELEAEDLVSDSVWVLTSDHGEGLGSHGYLGHAKNLFQEQLLVPLIVYSSSGSFTPRRVADLVRLVDLGPTLADLIGEDFSDQVVPTAGRSFRSLLETGSGWRAPLAFSQRMPASSEKRKAQGWTPGEVYALQDASHKILVRQEAHDSFFDLQADPFELRDLARGATPGEPPEFSQFQAKAVELFGRSWRDGEGLNAEGVDERHREELEALGYL